MNDIEDVLEKYPKGHFVGVWLGIGMAIFSGVGVVISFALKNYGLISIGPVLGVAVATAIGQSIDNKYQKKGQIRPLTASEIKQRRNMLIYGFVTLLIGLLFFIFFIFMQKA